MLFDKLKKIKNRKMSKPFVYDASVEAIAAKARVASSNEELAEICEQLNVADKIELGKVDLWLARRALSTVYRTLKKYPELRCKLNYFGTLYGFIQNKDNIFYQIHGINDKYLLDAVKVYTDELANSCLQTFKNNGLAVSFTSGVTDYCISGIIINAKSLNQQTILENLAYGEQSGHSPKGCNSIKYVMDHEIGHLLDDLLKIDGCYAYSKILRKYDKEFVRDNLSSYCVMDDAMYAKEVLAEGYAEYCNNPTPREIALAIGQMIDKRYKEKYNG